MTTAKNEAATHARRAAALFIHFANKDEEGFNAILDELDGPDDTMRLLLSLLGMFESVVPMLLTPHGVSIVRAVVTDLANTECADPS